MVVNVECEDGFVERPVTSYELQSLNTTKATALAIADLVRRTVPLGGQGPLTACLQQSRGQSVN
jgi:hypothetical protein